MKESGSDQKNMTWVQLYESLIFKFRYLIVAISLVAAVFIGSGGRFIEFSNDYRYFFSKSNPQLLDFEALQKKYTKNDNVFFAVTADKETVFEKDFLKAVKELTTKAWQVPYSIRVDSLTNYQHSYAEEDDLFVQDLVEEPDDLNEQRLKYIEDVALNEIILKDRIINDKKRVTGVNVTIELPGKNMHEATEVIKFTRALIVEMKKIYPHIDIRQTGMVPMSNSFAESAMKDMGSLVPIMYVGIILTMYLLLGSVWATLATLVIVSFSMMTAMGSTGWLGIKLTPPSSSAPTMIMTLAIADSIHLLISMFGFMRDGMNKREAMAESLRINFQPVLLTSFTTIIGFLSLNFSDAPPFRDLGNITAIGVAAAFLLSITTLPALINILPVKIGRGGWQKGKLLDWLAETVIRYQKALLWGSVTLTFVLGVGVFKNDLNDEFVKYFDKSVPFRANTDYVLENLTGIYQIEYDLGSGEASGISEPEYLQKVEEFAIWWRSKSDVIHVNAITDIFKRLNKNMHGDDKNYYKIPESRELAAQYLLLYEMSLPYGLDLNNQMDIEKSSSRFTITVKDMSSNRIRNLATAGENWLKENAPKSMHTHGVSPTVMFSYISQRNVNSMLGGTTIALFIISLIMGMALKSVKFGALSLIPNVLPALMAFGIWGILVGQIGLSVSIVTAMSLGIVVDDSVHFLSKYIRARRERGLIPEDAIRYAFKNVGMAMVVTSIILVVGFLILSFSSFKLNKNMGLLTAITIVIALVADFILLPTVLLVFDKAGIKNKQNQIPSTEPSSV